MGFILLIILIIVLIGLLPRWNYSKSWGYFPSGFLGLLLLVLVIMMLMGYIPRGF